MNARSINKAGEAIFDIKTEVPCAEIVILEIDLDSFSPVKITADAFLSDNDHLDILINNAGVFASPPGLTEEGYEIQFFTNYMGMPEKDDRIVNISSEIYRSAPKEGLLLSQVKTPLTAISIIARYGQLKLANIYFTQSDDKRYPNIKSIALHPRLVLTNIGGRMTANPIISFIFNQFSRVAEVDIPTGALNQLWASTVNPADVKSGA